MGRRGGSEGARERESEGGGRDGGRVLSRTTIQRCAVTKTA